MVIVHIGASNPGDGTAVGHLYINGSDVKQIAHDFYHSNGVQAYSFNVPSGKTTTVGYVMTCNGNIAKSGEFASVVIVHNS